MLDGGLKYPKMGFWYANVPKNGCDGLKLNVWLLNNYLLSSLFMFYIYCVIYSSKLLHLQTCFDDIRFVCNMSIKRAGIFSHPRKKLQKLYIMCELGAVS